jgi:hypothetical protein
MTIGKERKSPNINIAFTNRLFVCAEKSATWRCKHEILPSSTNTGKWPRLYLPGFNQVVIEYFEEGLIGQHLNVQVVQVVSIEQWPRTTRLGAGVM